MENYDAIANGFTSKMKREKAWTIYNHFSEKICVRSIYEAKDLLQFIRKLQVADDYLLQISKGGCK